MVFMNNGQQPLYIDTSQLPHVKNDNVIHDRDSVTKISKQAYDTLAVFLKTAETQSLVWSSQTQLLWLTFSQRLISRHMVELLSLVLGN